MAQAKKAVPKKEEKALVRQEKGGALELPEHMKGLAGAGTEALTPADMEVPRIKLLQGLSPEVQEGGFKANVFYHTVADDELGTEVAIVPVYVDQSYMLWRPRKSGGGILARALDGIHWNPPSGSFDVKLDTGKTVTWKLAPTVAKSNLAEWGSSDPSDPNSPPAATRMYNIVVMLPDLPPEFSPAVITLQRSAIKVARKFIGKLKITNAPSFGQRFIMSGFKDNSPAGEFYNFKFTADGLVLDPEEFAKYKDMYEFFKKEGLKIKDVEGLQETEEPAHAAVD